MDEGDVIPTVRTFENKVLREMTPDVQEVRGS
jgi:hypothetical protein